MSGALNESTFSDTGSHLSWSMARSSIDTLSESINRSSYDKVVFHDVLDIYPELEDLKCKYSLTSGITKQPDDRIGLYKLGETLPQNYIVSQWISDISNQVVRFKGSDLPRDDEEFYQLYYVSNREIIGASTPFQFRGGGQPTFADSVDDDDLVIVKYQAADDDTEERIQALKNRCQLLEKRHHDSERERELLMELHEKRNNELQEKQAEITDLNNQLTEIRKSQKRLCERVTGMEESTEKAHNEKKSALQEKQKCESVIEELKQKTDTLQKDKDLILQTRNECEKLMAEMQSKLEKQEKEKDSIVKQQRSEKSKQLTAELQCKLDTVSQNYEERLKDMEGTMKQTVQQHHEVKVMLESEKRATQIELEEKRKKVTDLDRQILSLSLRNHENMLHIDTLQATILTETMEKEKLCKQLKDVLKDNESLRMERAELLKEKEAASVKDECQEELLQRVNKLTDHVSSLESQKKDLETALDDSTERRQQAQVELSRLSVNMTHLHNTNLNLREQKSVLEKECDELRNFVKELQQRLKMSAEQFQNQYIIIHNLNKKIKKLEMDKKARATKEPEQRSSSVETHPAREERSSSDSESLSSSKGLEEVEKRIIEEINRLTVAADEPKITTCVRPLIIPSRSSSLPMHASTSSSLSSTGSTTSGRLPTAAATASTRLPSTNLAVASSSASDSLLVASSALDNLSEEIGAASNQPVAVSTSNHLQEGASAASSFEGLEAAAAPSLPPTSLKCPFCDFESSLENRTENQATEELTLHVENQHLPLKCPACPLEFQPGEFSALERHAYIAHYNSEDDDRPPRLGSWDLGID